MDLCSNCLSPLIGIDFPQTVLAKLSFCLITTLYPVVSCLGACWSACVVACCAADLSLCCGLRAAWTSTSCCCPDVFLPPTCAQCVLLLAPLLRPLVLHLSRGLWRGNKLQGARDGEKFQPPFRFQLIFGWHKCLSKVEGQGPNEIFSVDGLVFCLFVYHVLLLKSDLAAWRYTVYFLPF